MHFSSSQGELRTDNSSCEQPSECVSPQGPTEGCGVIPVKGRSMCIDPDPGGYHAAGLTVILTPDRPCCTIPLILCRRAHCDSHLRFTWKHASKYSQAGFSTVLLLHVFFMLFGSFSPFVAFRFLRPFFRFQVSFREGVRRPKSAILESQ